MTVIYSRNLSGEPAAHALIVGVGSYQHLAKPGYGPPDLQSAVAGAASFALWLINNADRLTPRIATIDLFLSPPEAAIGEFRCPANVLHQQGAIDPRDNYEVALANSTEINAARANWLGRLNQADSSALVYISGHGVATSERTMIFLSDVNHDPDQPWNPHIDLQIEKTRITRNPNLNQSFVFVDACQEFIRKAALDEADKQNIIRDPVSLFRPTIGATRERRNLYMLTPTAFGAKAWDDRSKTGGRFTKVLLEALNGAAASNYNGVGEWGVRLLDLHARMRKLYDLHPEWKDKSFEPTPQCLPLDDPPFITFEDPPKIPVCLSVRPDAARPSIQSVTYSDVLGAENRQVFPVGGSGPNPAMKHGQLMVTWPKASARQHSVQIQFDPNATDTGSLPNADKQTQLDISQMRVSPAIQHDVS